MNKKTWNKRIAKVCVTALLLIVLPVMAVSMNGKNQMTAHAEDTPDTDVPVDNLTTTMSDVDVPDADDDVQDTTDDTGDGTDGAQDAQTDTDTADDGDTSGTDTDATDGTDDSADVTSGDDADTTDDANAGDDADTGDSADAGDDATDGDTDTDDHADDHDDQPLPGCICGERCTSFKWNENCPRCSKYKEECAYVEPNVKIEINAPNGWFKDAALVTFTVEDIAESGNFRIESIKAKISQNGSWVDVTEERRISISENCTVYVLVNDARGKQYEKNRHIACFDFTKPTLNASISNGRLSVIAQDTESGVKAIYVDSYEFSDLTNGTVNIQLQKFDAGYEYFSIQALDNAGNLSDVYRIANPYYKNPEKPEEEDKSKDLPESAEVKPPSTAQGTVTDYSQTDTRGGNINLPGSGAPSGNSSFSSGVVDESGRDAFEEDDEDKSTTAREPEVYALGKEFYTIETANGKVFYLVIDRTKEEPVTYFLTEITENDLLNVTQGAENMETLPQNAAVTGEDAVPVTETAYPNNNTQGMAIDTSATQTPVIEQTPAEEETEEEPTEEEEEPAEEPKKDHPILGYLILFLLAGGAVGAYYFLKIRKRKGEDFIDEDEDDAALNNEEEEEDDDDDWFDDDDEETEDNDADEGFLDDDLPEDYAGEGDLEFLDFDMDDAVEDAIRDEERYARENEANNNTTTEVENND